MLSWMTRILESRKVTGLIIGVLSFMVLFLFVWKSGVDSSPKRHEIAEEDMEEKPRPKVNPKTQTLVSDDPESFRAEKRTFIFNHMGEKYRRICRMQSVGTSSCARLACDDGKIYCVSSYTEL